MEDFNKDDTTFHSWHDFVLASIHKSFKKSFLKKERQEPQQIRAVAHHVAGQMDNRLNAHFDEHLFI